MNVFDIIGPIMIGPSSSHTAGAVRLGFMARLLLGEEPNIEITKLNGKDVVINGHNPAIIVEYKDIPGRISKICEVAAKNRINISQMHISRDKRGGTAIVTIQVDGENVKDKIKYEIEKLEYIYNVILVPIID